ncbi:hypothetical protein [Actinophytocola xinjiangensis]|nr:hypothetical protein [Actinophytocola xinjiangensis]
MGLVWCLAGVSWWLMGLVWCLAGVSWWLMGLVRRPTRVTWCLIRLVWCPACLIWARDSGWSGADPSYPARDSAWRPRLVWYSIGLAGADPLGLVPDPRDLVLNPPGSSVLVLDPFDVALDLPGLALDPRDLVLDPLVWCPACLVWR